MSAARTERLLNLLTLLLNTRRPIALRDIREMEEFRAYNTRDPKSGERAFERDKAVLVELGVPLRWVAPELDEDGEAEGTGGYIIDRDRYYLPELNLAPGEVAMLSIAGAAAVAVDHFPGKAAVIRALAKLGFDVDESAPASSLAHTPLLAGVDAARTGQNLEVLHEAVARRARVHMTYQGASGRASQREVDPYGLYYRQGVWYLVGHCHLRGGQRTFHLGRMTEVRVVPGSKPEGDFVLPEDFDLSEVARRRPWEYGDTEPQEVKILLAARLVPAIGEIFGERVVVEPHPEGALLTLRVSSTSALIATVLPYGAAAQVVSPPELRARIGGLYAELAERYAHQPNEDSGGEGASGGRGETVAKSRRASQEGNLP